MTLRTALFDLDGTLTDPELGITRCIAHALSELDAPVPPQAELRNWIGAPLHERFVEFLSSTARADDALSLYRRRFTEVGMFENEPYAGIREALLEIRRGVDQAFVVTSKPTVFARQIVRHFDLHGYFDDVYGSELDGRFANKVDLMAHVVSDNQLAPEATTMIGDRRFDIHAARHHNIRSIGVLWGFGDRAELEEAGADALCAAVAELPRSVEEASA